MSRHQLQHEAQEQENSPTPPARFGEKVSRLTNSDESIRGRARAAKIGGEPGTFAGLEQNGRHQDDAVDDEQSQKKRVKH